MLSALPEILYQERIYIVDYSIRQLRYCVYGEMPHYVDLDSKQGQEIILNGSIII